MHCNTNLAFHVSAKTFSLTIKFSQFNSECKRFIYNFQNFQLLVFVVLSHKYLNGYILFHLTSNLTIIIFYLVLFYEMYS